MEFYEEVRAFRVIQGKFSSACIVILSRCRFPIALLVKPLRIDDLRDFIGVITHHLQLILRKRRMVRLERIAYQALAVTEQITKILAERQK